MESVIKHTPLLISENPDENRDSSRLVTVIKTLTNSFSELTALKHYTFNNFKVDHSFKDLESWLKQTEISVPVAIIEVKQEIDLAHGLALLLLSYYPEKIRYLVPCIKQRDSLNQPLFNDLSLKAKGFVRQTDYELCLKETNGLICAYLTSFT